MIEPNHLIELIKNEWTDIHHSRNQEWTCLAIIGGLLYALFKAETYDLKQIISIFGLIACILSIMMSYRHWVLFRSKVQIIRSLQKEMGIVFNFNENEKWLNISVQSILMFFYYLLCCALIGTFIWDKFQLTRSFCIVSVIVLVIGVIMCFVFFPKLVKKKAEKVEVKLLKPNGYILKVLKGEDING